MITLSDLQKYLDNYLYFDKNLDLVKIDPYMTNGLMVKGAGDIDKIGFGVSASIALFHKAKDTDCQCIIVHHSFNQPSNNRYDYIFQERIAFLIRNNISLFGYHFLLDAHPEIGNNVQIIKAIEAKPKEPYFQSNEPWGWIGEYQKDKELTYIINLLKHKLSPRTLFYNYGPINIKKVAVCSGKGAPSPSEMQDLINKKIDLYITGEAHEWNRELFREAKINFIAGGHYHTEIFGIEALVDKVKKQFSDVKTEWLDLDNQV